MAKQFDGQGFRDPIVQHITDMVQDMLNGPQGEIAHGKVEAETMRVCLDIPKAWILFAAWHALSERDLITDELRLWQVHECELTDDAVWDYMRRRVRPYLTRLLEAELHVRLFAVSNGRDSLFWKREDNPFNDGPERPF